MCTNRQQNPVQTVKGGPADIKKPPPKPPITSFQKFLDDARLTELTNLEPSSMVINGFTLKSKKAAMSIILLDNPPALLVPDHQYAGINDTDMDYSGSLVKVAAVYTAFELRAMARKHAADNHFTDEATFISSFDTTINTSVAVKPLRDFGKGLKPELQRIFKGFQDTGPNQVNFRNSPANNSFQNDLDNFPKNEHAGAVIRALGYSYINVVMMRERFFDAASSKGIWLAGDYSGESILKSVRVPVENDTVPGGSGQAITTKEMSRMFQLFHLGKAFPMVANAAAKQSSNDDMHTLLQTAEGMFFSNGTTTIQVAPALVHHTRDCSKVGIGKLGPITQTNTPSVLSEGGVFKRMDTAQVSTFNSRKQRNLTGEFVFVWQNMYPPNSHFNALLRILNAAIEKFLTQA
jgi:hypothetical protein